MDVVKIERMCDTFFVVILACILLSFQLSLSECSIVVDGDLRICSEDLTGFEDNQRVDFNHITIFFHKAVVHVLQEEYNLALVLLNSKILSYLTKLINTQSFVNINWHFEDLFRGIVSDVLNCHSTSW